MRKVEALAQAFTLGDYFERKQFGVGRRARFWGWLHTRLWRLCEVCRGFDEAARDMDVRR